MPGAGTAGQMRHNNARVVDGRAHGAGGGGEEACGCFPDNGRPSVQTLRSPPPVLGPPFLDWCPRRFRIRAQPLRSRPPNPRPASSGQAVTPSRYPYPPAPPGILLRPASPRLAFSTLLFPNAISPCLLCKPKTCKLWARCLSPSHAKRTPPQRQTRLLGLWCVASSAAQNKTCAKAARPE
jgi:hypothetical protein